MDSVPNSDWINWIRSEIAKVNTPVTTQLCINELSCNHNSMQLLMNYNNGERMYYCNVKYSLIIILFSLHFNFNLSFCHFFLVFVFYIPFLLYFYFSSIFSLLSKPLQLKVISVSCQGDISHFHLCSKSNIYILFKLYFNLK